MGCGDADDVGDFGRSLDEQNGVRRLVFDPRECLAVLTPQRLPGLLPVAEALPQHAQRRRQGIGINSRGRFRTFSSNLNSSLCHSILRVAF